MQIERRGNVLYLAGRIGIEQAAEVHRAMLDAMAAEPTLELDLSGLTAVDLTLVQMVIASQRQGARCVGRFPDCLSRLLVGSGFGDLLKAEAAQ
jgi:hypothetical protein